MVSNERSALNWRSFAPKEAILISPLDIVFSQGLSSGLLAF